ncbi:pyruvate, phosphate dikinase [Desulfobacula toluolica]|uniref:Pyruvate, phosphate dikinase n=1 Tax=Desulfobacula toluolica (strain DSM 7467 / Tol2) TaxID=651182 RepID=K0NAD4_DESTT|nr:pyruvate, phosphate dikinase [Desulfobacula toluolica]CCK80989.1 PpdK: pyruvate, phosphate dikinase [Desulfobacula toluolica Tol2]
MTKKWVYLFDEIDAALQYANDDWEKVRGLLGGKGANLGEMTRINIPVPPGFTITTEACIAYLDSSGTFPDRMWEQVQDGLADLEKRLYKKFGDPENPLLISCRSGGKFSMPGMMDTVLNIGLNDQTLARLIAMSRNPRFAYDSFRRLIQMFGNVVMGIDDALFEDIISNKRLQAGVKHDTELDADHWKAVCEKFKTVFSRQSRHPFPEDPMEQLKRSIEAVFKSWNGKRAIDYRNAANIPHNLGTAVTIQAMVFGNIGNDCATGVALTRNGTTGENVIEGDYLVNAQGEDVVAGIRQTQNLKDMSRDMPETYHEFERIAKNLEDHYREMQDVEFTIEKGKLWMLQTRDGKRTAQAAVRIAVEMTMEGMISKKKAVMRVTPEQVDFFLHPQFDPTSLKKAEQDGNKLASGLNVSPGAAVGQVAFDADIAQAWATKENKKVIMVRPETKPDDVHGMLASEGILTSRGGRTSHAALVARQFGKPAVVGVSDILIDMSNRSMTVNDLEIKEGDWISVDGTSGDIYLGKLSTIVPDIKDPWLIKLLSWADQFRHLGVWANADYPGDAKRALDYGAEGIGLCRSEHMFFETERLPHFRKMIMTDFPLERRESLEALLPFQREDFAGLFRVMDGKSVVIRLIDPPLHEFLPDHIQLLKNLSDLKLQIRDAATLKHLDDLLEEIRAKETLLKRVEILRESNPMLGLRGVRLGIVIPELTSMQVRAIFEAACMVIREGGYVKPKIMIPLTSHVNELKQQRQVLEDEAEKVMHEHDIRVDYSFGTMIELPRAALTADQIAEHASFVSFGTNDLTQTTFGISRDDAETGFLVQYMESGILPENPFETIDREGVGRLLQIAMEKGRSVRPDLECGICGEHGGDPQSIHLCHDLKLTYVSCSPFRVPIARLAAAHAAIRSGRAKPSI